MSKIISQVNYYIPGQLGNQKSEVNLLRFIHPVDIAKNKGL